MDYGLEIYITTSDNNDNLEIIHHKFCTFALGVAIYCSYVIWLFMVKLGCTPLLKIQMVKYWQRLTTK